ncbi:aldo/keto reductase [Mucilaginibacter rubeus]|uniref:Aldo/keto reductase n=1 Tax=Mucilaginibacter rubeus TaxID=2027860 RepID=A0AAE6JBL8_9SPHI|nr:MULTISPECIES: aldo/keto reductase [Mucilaginibacter]QEM02476.1 aldo/keto reductase [Mucilaginibacter rubeus]QEM15098.1 aldo/keto reductase [Mucilaginibacter gossypii]QTE42180.1 aldo/keto reductase [Mucilaginibacter rubeus]QTE48782.1 aldo/keto reductase [Mucilaginibacter rubeus]QTE53880.1 aldo/keto reductase [Mucilaginibacter rubeus]
MQEINLPKVIFGTSGLGNLYVALPDDVKCAIVAESIRHSPKPAVFDSAGKYGAGLALESLGKALAILNVSPSEVLISNKLGWLRTALKSPEPTFEPGVWRDLKYDAVQRISYEGILECYEQGNELLGNYRAQLVSVHDPDEYLNAAKDKQEQAQRYRDILDAYRALIELKRNGKVKGIGVGSKDWRIIKMITQDVKLDWVMIANSMTIHSHPPELIEFMQELEKQGTLIINSAVFNGGFLTGSDYYNYRLTDPVKDKHLHRWRELFYRLCENYKIKPADACVAFGLNGPGVKSIALNTTNPNRVAQNISLASLKIPTQFWKEMKEYGLVDESYASAYL